MRHARSIHLIPDETERLEPIDQAALRSMTAGDLRAWEQLGGTCGACRRHGRLDKADIRRRFGAAALADLQPLLHCMRCDNRQTNRFTVSALARD